MLFTNSTVNCKDAIKSLREQTFCKVLTTNVEGETKKRQIR